MSGQRGTGWLVAHGIMLVPRSQQPNQTPPPIVRSKSTIGPFPPLACRLDPCCVLWVRRVFSDAAEGAKSITVAPGAQSRLSPSTHPSAMPGPLSLSVHCGSPIIEYSPGRNASRSLILARSQKVCTPKLRRRRRKKSSHS